MRFMDWNGGGKKGRNQSYEAVATELRIFLYFFKNLSLSLPLSLSLCLSFLSPSSNGVRKNRKALFFLTGRRILSEKAEVDAPRSGEEEERTGGGGKSRRGAQGRRVQGRERGQLRSGTSPQCSHLQDQISRRGRRRCRALRLRVPQGRRRRAAAAVLQAGPLQVGRRAQVAREPELEQGHEGEDGRRGWWWSWK
ncbi:uncharacterized protein M6B38_286065 [Iris pallida]|uniref:Uncharacterized protein n=1 Tax=Iris pallida TaxID=29817 RepID=A0AAX6HY78_IRIPA|nr:uncharacterized protein M6B38_286065 [Iris pallida]